MKQFDIPVALFIFRRHDTLKRIIDQLREVQVSRIYLISDGPRNEKERAEVHNCREIVEKSIDWNCAIFKNYAIENKGVYDRIGLGAKWVFDQEPRAIFLEDDNLPEISFFPFCSELLEKYDKDTRIFWICGTNYLGKYATQNDESYVFTKHLLPCGWASWSWKYNRFYDGEMSLFKGSQVKKILSDQYPNKLLFRQQFQSFERTKYLLEKDQRSSSWDYQAAFSIRMHGLYGISPRFNQIKNIGVDEISEHGGNSFRHVMTRRFCGMDSYPLEFPLIHPKNIIPDAKYEYEVGNLILLPWYLRLMKGLARIVKPILGLKEYESLTSFLRKKNLKRG